MKWQLNESLPLPLRKCFLMPLTLITLFLGCSKDSSQSDRDFFRINIPTEVSGIDPGFATTQAKMWIVSQIYETLVSVDSNMKLIPELATRWEILDSGRRYRFYIREGIKFHNSESPLTAHDVAASFYRLIDPEVAAPGAWIFNNRVRKDSPFVVVNDSIIDIYLKRPFAPFIYMLTMPYTSIISRQTLSTHYKDLHRYADGTGPFKLQTWQEEALILTKNHNYWKKDNHGNQLPYIDGIIFSFITDPQVELHMFLQNNLDFITAGSPPVLNKIMDKTGKLYPDILEIANPIKHSFLNTEYLGFLLDSAALDSNHRVLLNPLVRKALSLAIDRVQLINTSKYGLGSAISPGFVHSGMWNSPETIPSFDPVLAAKLLARAGYPGGKGFPELTIYTPPSYLDYMIIVQKQWEDNLGIKANIEVMQPGTLREMMVEGKLPIFRGSWIADYPDPETFLVVFYSHMPAPPNYTRFQNPLFDSLYNQALETFDESQRHKLYKQMDSIIIEQAPVIVLFHDQALRLLSKRVKGFKINDMGMFNLEYVSITK